MLTLPLIYDRVQPVTTKGVALVEKTSLQKLKILTTPKLVPKTEPLIAFRVAFKLDVEIAWFGCQMAVCANKRHKNAIFGVVYFKYALVCC